jgi:Pyruvate/2-oxoacid:ferredoxin oxidoreductase gamma subunit
VDAAEIASRHGIGSRTQPIVNTAILGAFARWSRMVSLDAVCAAIGEEIEYRPESNMAAAREAAEAVQIADVAREVAHA